MSVVYLNNLDRSGGAVHLVLCPPVGATQLVVLRRHDDAFNDDFTQDQSSVVIYRGGITNSILDWQGILPCVPHWYKPFYYVNNEWQSAAAQSITPTIETHPPLGDSLDVVRERVEIGLNALVAARHLHHPRQRFHVLTAPPQMDDVVFPCVAVYLSRNNQEEQFVGSFISEGKWDNNQVHGIYGGLGRYSVQIITFSLNHDERRLLRLSLRDILIANRDLFESLGMYEMQYNFHDDEDFQSYSAPMYRTTCEMDYLAFDVITDAGQAMTDTFVTIPDQPEPSLTKGQI